MDAASRRRNFLINLSFMIGIVLLVAPDFFLYGAFTDPRRFWLDEINTIFDAVVFSTVFFLLKRDIATRKRLNEQLKTTNRQKTEVLQIASHDLRNPLNAMVLLASELPPDPAAATPGENPGAQISALAYEMQGIIEELIDAAVLGDGNLKINRTPTDVSACVEEIVLRNRPQAERKGQPLEFAPPGPLVAEVDPARFKQALDNLISNAIKFSPPGGAITVSVRSDGHEIRIEVADQGPGLTEEDKAKLFGRFQKLSARPTGGEASTGLGLANSRRLVELNGGRIGAESNGPGTGSRFWIKLPLAVP
ncbi:MAG: sensor histidine kinase [Chthoniobacteraceae bacterium]